MKSIQRMKPVSKLLAGLLALMLMLTVGIGAFAEQPSGGETPEEGALIGPRTARVFIGTLDSQDTLTTWEVAGEEHGDHKLLSLLAQECHVDIAQNQAQIQPGGGE